MLGPGVLLLVTLPSAATALAHYRSGLAQLDQRAARRQPVGCLAARPVRLAAAALRSRRRDCAPGRLVAREDMTVALTVLAGRLCDPQVADKAVGLSHSVKFGPAQLRFAFTPAS